MQDDMWQVKTAWPNNPNCNCLFILDVIFSQILSAWESECFPQWNVLCVFIKLYPSSPCMGKIQATLTDAAALIK